MRIDVVFESTRQVAAVRLGPVMVVALALLLTACGATKNRAPVEDRIGRKPSSMTAAATSLLPLPVELPKLLPGAENAGKPGYYSVKAGDTLIRIGLESGQNWRDLVRWNGLDNANLIEVGQVLRVVPPQTDLSVASTRPISSARVETRPLDSRTAGATTPLAPLLPAAGGTASGPVPAELAATASNGVATMTATAPLAEPVPALLPALPAPTAAPRVGDDDVNWAWPAAGSLGAPFEEGKVKGLAINGRAGDPVVAAADGRVVYAGSGLRGYGNLVILKHNNTYLTAYAHNQTLLVKEDQNVKRGQRIAEMGSSDTDRVQLHFEIRKQGKPIDPTRLLPPR